MEPSLWMRALRWLLPWACAGCGESLACVNDDGFCGRCWLSIKRIQEWVCHACGLPLPEGGQTCHSCRKEAFFPKVRSAAVFQGPLRRALHRFKYFERPSLIRSLKVLMAWGWDRYPELHESEVLVPVPLYRGMLRKRGYNQADLLAQELGRAAGREVLPGLLLRPRKTKPQARLNRKDRFMNLAGAFTIPSGGLAQLRGRSVLLIDDVCTTGATLRACAWALREGGVRKVQAYTLARDL